MQICCAKGIKNLAARSEWEAFTSRDSIKSQKHELSGVPVLRKGANIHCTVWGDNGPTETAGLDTEVSKALEQQLRPGINPSLFSLPRTSHSSKLQYTNPRAFDHVDDQDQALSPATNNETKFLSLQEDAEEAAYANKSTGQKVVTVLMYLTLALAAMYVFMVAIKLIGEGFTLALGCSTKGAFDFANNPVAGLMVGTISTALLHSSSTVTSITVALVGAGGMTIRQGVYVVMGANVGTCITCIMVAFAQVGDRARFQRAMAAATVHDMYNIWSVIVMFPLEIAFQPLERLSRAMSNSKVSGGDFKSPVDVVVGPLVQSIIVVDKKTIYKIATGEKTCEPGTSFITKGWFKDAGMSDTTAGSVVVVIGFCFLVVALVVLVKMLAKVFLGPTKRVISKILNYNGYVNIIAGTGVTFLVHSSTIVTSTLTPMAGLGVITLEQVYPIMIGSNLGTTGTALIAAMVTGKSDSVAIALVHFGSTFSVSSCSTRSRSRASRSTTGPMHSRTGARAGLYRRSSSW